MLAYILAIIVAIGSFSFYMAAFFVPEMHRRQDFFWSGLGLFYAVVLWFCAGRLTGAVLLGQLVSVALLGGLGWHTLALRRDLTPELVQTPVTWDDVQKLTQDLQRLVRQHGRLDDIANFGRATWGAITRIVTSWRDRAATIPDTEASPEVPPLRRSPAYEFETAPGDGQAVSTEFATVANRQRPPQTPADSPEIPETPESLETKEWAEETEAAIAEAPAAPADNAEAAQPSVEPATADETAATADETAATADETAATADEIDVAATTASTSAAPRSVPESSIKPPRQTAAAAVPSPSAPSPQSSDQPPPKSARQTNPVSGIINWVGNFIGAGRKPEPERGVIEIPPRPPSIPKDPNAPPAKSEASRPSRSAQAPRAVIDIPPRPPSIPRSPADASASPTVPNSASSSQPVVDDDTNWVDVGDVTPTVTDRPPESPEPTSSGADTRWPGAEDETISPRDDSLSPSGSTAPQDDDTNWPDDEDTNWPD